MEDVKARIAELEDWIGKADLAQDPLAAESLKAWNTELLQLNQTLNRGKINGLIAGSKANPKVDDADITAIFEKYANAVSAFERTGVDTLTAKLQDEIDNDGEFKKLLTSFVDADDTITVFMAITGALNA